MKYFNLHAIVVGPLETNCYLLSDAATKNAIIIDPGGETERIAAAISAQALTPKAIVLTHGHADHIAAIKGLKKLYPLTVYIHEADMPYLDTPDLNGSSLIGTPFTSPAADVALKDGDTITVDALKLTVYHTPGHTPGGTCLLFNNVLFTGDTLFRGSIGRWDFPGGSREKLLAALQIFRTFPGETMVYPGHGPASDIKTELEQNPYLVKS